MYIQIIEFLAIEFFLANCSIIGTCNCTSLLVTGNMQKVDVENYEDLYGSLDPTG